MSMQNPIVWVHGDCLSPRHPALAAYPGAPAIFVWDEELLVELRVSLKRIVFIYECLLELPVTIRRGDVAVEVLAFAEERGADGIVTSDSPGPRFRRIRERLEAALPVRVIPVEPFVRAPRQLDLARFSRYWRAIQAEVLSDSADNAL
ncbi:MAG: hypothetical protein RMK84_14265 [Oscillochloridaceae bacterium]|nr:hypothetical protein [Chloroflexaceae bacterium]MDW8391286.1 hypothetical protein [Oscillochloridaceae bacterium]